MCPLILRRWDRRDDDPQRQAWIASKATQACIWGWRFDVDRPLQADNPYDGGEGVEEFGGKLRKTYRGDNPWSQYTKSQIPTNKAEIFKPFFGKYGGPSIKSPKY